MSKRKPDAPERRRPGRPTKLTYELGDRIVKLIRAGNYVEVAAQVVGVSKQRFYDWAAKAAEYDDATEEELDLLDDETLLYVWFRDAYKTAEAEAERDLLEKTAAADTHWQAHMTIMQRRFGRRWREKTDVDVSVDDAGARRTDPTPEEVEELTKAFGMQAASEVAAGPEAVRPPEDA